MSRYLLSVHSVEDQERPSMTEEEMREWFEPVARLEAEMRSEGVLLFGGRLEEAKAARVLRPYRPRVHATDGPFAETKEHLGGFYLIEAPDDAAAFEWASKVTLAINAPIELRAFTHLSDQ